MNVLYFFLCLFLTFCSAVDTQIRIKNQEESDKLKSNFTKSTELEDKNTSTNLLSYHSEKIYNDISQSQAVSKSSPTQSSAPLVVSSNFDNQLLSKKNQKNLDTYNNANINLIDSNFFVQIGAFLNESEANSCFEKFKNLSNFKDENIFIKKDGMYYKVRVGPFKSRSAVDNERKRISELANQFNDSFVVNGN